MTNYYPPPEQRPPDRDNMGRDAGKAFLSGFSGCLGVGLAIIAVIAFLLLAVAMCGHAQSQNNGSSSKCTNNCVVSVSTSESQVALQGSNAPTYPPPSFPAAVKAECKSLGGDATTYGFDGGPYSYECDHVDYVGTDGMNNYYVNIPVRGGSLINIGTAGTGATERECTNGWYPDASTGNPSGIPGKWDAALGLCLPTVSNDYQDQFRH